MVDSHTALSSDEHQARQSRAKRFEAHLQASSNVNSNVSGDCSVPIIHSSHAFLWLCVVPWIALLNGACGNRNVVGCHLRRCCSAIRTSSKILTIWNECVPLLLINNIIANVLPFILVCSLRCVQLRLVVCCSFRSHS